VVVHAQISVPLFSAKSKVFQNQSRTILGRFFDVPGSYSPLSCADFADFSDSAGGIFVILGKMQSFRIAHVDETSHFI